MRRTVALVLLVAGLAAATSPVWALDPGNPTFSPDPASPGQSVDFSGSVTPGGLKPGPCDVRGQDSSTPFSSCSYDDAGVFSGWVVVPSSATPGAPYVLVFCGPSGCSSTERTIQWSATNAVGILPLSPPPVGTVTVPTVHCRAFAEGVSLLRASGLAVAPTTFSGPIGRVAPLGGTTVSSGSTVTPFPPLVPDVVGRPVAAAASMVAWACGLASPIGVGEVVLSQSPSSGVELPHDQRVVLVLQAAPPPPPPSAPSSPWPPILVTVGVVLLVGSVTWLAVRHSGRGSPGTGPSGAVTVRARPVDRTPPAHRRAWDVPEPDLVVVRHPTTSWMEELS